CIRLSGTVSRASTMISPSSSPHAPRSLAGEMLAAESTIRAPSCKATGRKGLAPAMRVGYPCARKLWEHRDMKFVRAIWKLLVGIKDALVLIFMLLFFGFLYAALS